MVFGLTKITTNGQQNFIQKNEVEEILRILINCRNCVDCEKCEQCKKCSNITGAINVKGIHCYC